MDIGILNNVKSVRSLRTVKRFTEIELKFKTVIYDLSLHDITVWGCWYFSCWVCQCRGQECNGGIIGGTIGQRFVVFVVQILRSEVKEITNVKIDI